MTYGLVAIEDLGNIEVFFTDKTGTLTEGRITFASALDAHGRGSDEVLRAGLLCNEAVLTDGQVVGGNQLDRAVWESPSVKAVAPADVSPRRCAAILAWRSAALSPDRSWTGSTTSSSPRRYPARRSSHG
jgi:Mg2+-importing ATPase